MCFIDNKYTKIYFSIIERARVRTLSVDEYKEKHHIIPQSFFLSKSKTGWLSGYHNADENKVYLTAREHFVCHRLLVKMTEGTAHRKMTFALKRFLYAPNHQTNIKSRMYEYVKKLNSTAMKGKPHSEETKEKIRIRLLNKAPISEETREKLRAAARRRKGFTPEGRASVIASNRARVVTEETKMLLREARARQVERQGGTMTAEAREKLSRAAKGRVLTEIHKQRITEAMARRVLSPDAIERIREGSRNRKNTKHTEEYKARLSEITKGIPKKIITCPHCGKAGGEPQMKRWHFDKCKNILMRY